MLIEKMFWCLLIIALLWLVLLSILSLWFPSLNECDLTCQKCCGGSPCTDTYYDSTKDVCISTLCQNSLINFMPNNKTKCEYKPYR